MGCNSSINVQTNEDKDNRIIKVNNKNEINPKNHKDIEKDDIEQDNNEYLDIESAKKIQNGNTDIKSIVNNDISDIHKMNINKNLYNYKSTNFNYQKEKRNNLHKSNPILNENKKEELYNNTDYIALKHPLDNSSDDVEEQQNQITNKKEIVNVTTSMEERINNYKKEVSEQIEEDGVNIGNYNDDENDDMCNFGESMDNEKITENKNNKNEICVIFEIQSTGEKYNINAIQDIKFNDLVEIFKKKINLSSFERPEFMLNGVYLIDYDKSIAEYNITDKSKINVYI